MKNISAFRNVLVVIGVVITFTLLGTTRAATAGEKGRSFAASLSGTAQWDGGPVAQCHSTGIASGLGLTSSDCTAELDLYNYGPNEECAGEGTGNGLPNVNTMVLTAASGDKLVLVSIDLACELGFLRFHGTGHWTVDSSASTGRFAGATGAGVLDGHADFYEGTSQVSLIGEITY